MINKSDTSKMSDLNKTLTDFGSKVYVLGLEHKGFDNKYLEVNEAKKAIADLFMGIVGEDEVFTSSDIWSRNKLREELRQAIKEEMG